MTEGDIYLGISVFIIWMIGFVAYRRMRARQLAEELAMEEKLRAFRERMEADRQATRLARAKVETAKSVDSTTKRVVETKAHRDRYEDRRAVDTSDDTLQNMLIINAISDNVSRSTTYDYTSSSSYSSDSSSSYDSGSSSSDSGSSSSCD
jgi:hypothetical protein